MPRRGQAQSADHPWKKRAEAEVKRAIAKKSGTSDEARRTTRAPFACVTCGDLDCIAGECVSDF